MSVFPPTLGPCDWFPTLGVVPVLVGPIQALLALLPALLVGLAAFLAALFTPRGLRRALRFFWRQKLFSLLLLLFSASCLTGWPWQRIARGSRAALGIGPVTSEDWPMFRGDPGRTGQGPHERDPEIGINVWDYSVDPIVYSSPAIAGDLVVVSTAADISPFNPTGRGAIVAIDIVSGQAKWRYAPDDYRATFSSPVISDGFVVCGEGLHQVQDARITCLDMNGRLQWEFRTSSHVESTAAIADGRVFVGAGGDGFYCLDLRGDGQGGPRVLWHLDGKEFPDCESSPLVVGDQVIFGLGEGGHAVCAVDVRTGEERWRVATPYPVFTSPTLIPGTGESAPKLAIAMGNGNFVQSAGQIREQKLAALREAGASAGAIREAERHLAPGGQVWCLDLASQEVDWRYLIDDTVLGSIAARDGRLYFGCRDGSVHCLSDNGQVLRTGQLLEPIVSSPALGRGHLYLTTSAGRLFALDLHTLRPAWDSSLGDGENFTSSPVIARGHVYVGSQQHGLMCVGTTGFANSLLWNRGDVGGVADQDAPPSLPRVIGQWPAQESKFESHFEVQSPLTVADGQIIAVAKTSTGQQLVKLDFDVKSEQSDRIAWQVPCAIVKDLAPLVVGKHFVAVELFSRLGGPSNAEVADLPEMAWPQLVARDLETGLPTWRMALPPVDARQWTCNARWIYVVGSRGIGGFASRDGMPGWANYLAAPTDVTIALADDVLLTADGNSWSALDSDTGISLWNVTAPEGHARVLDAHGAQFVALVTQANQPPKIQLRQVLDGALIWQADWPEAVDIRSGRLSAEQVLVASSAGHWHAYRLADGSRIEFSPQSEIPAVEGEEKHGYRASALLFRSQVIDVQGAGLRMHGLDDGVSREWLSLEETGRPISPLVASRGRVFFVNDRGKIVCIGARGSAP